MSWTVRDGDNDVSRGALSTGTETREADITGGID
jgi:hypothetical protein